MLTIGSILYLAWLAWEQFTIQAGRLKNTSELAAHTFLVSVYNTLSALSFGSQTTTSAFVGNAMGQGDKTKAIKLAFMGIILTLMEGAIIANLLGFRGFLFNFYTKEEKVKQLSIGSPWYSL